MSRRTKPVKAHLDPALATRVSDLDEMRELLADAQEDAAEWRRFAESTDIEWIYEVCMSKARGCEQAVARWRRRISQAS